MRNKSFIPAIAGWRGQSPGGGGQRRALAVKMNNFFEEDGKPEVPAGTWPLKAEKRRRPRRPRPLTATLERPRLLDIALQGKIDMSLMRKELLSIYTLMRVPLIVKQPPRQIKRTKGPEISDESLDDENTLPVKVKAKFKKGSRNNEGIPSIVIDVPHPLKETPRIPVLRRDKSPLKLVAPMGLKAKTRARSKIDEAFCGPVARPLAQPCDSCGRTSRPERLHTHPPPPSPVAPTARLVCLKLNASARPHGADITGDKLPRRPSPVRRAGSEAPRPSRAEPEHVVGVPLLCSFCGRRFGRASIAIHEAKCRERRDVSPAKSSRQAAAHQTLHHRLSSSPSRRFPSPKKADDQKGRTETPEKKNSKPQQFNLAVPVMHSPRTKSPRASPRGTSDSPARSSPRRGATNPGRVFNSPAKLSDVTPRVSDSPARVSESSSKVSSSPARVSDSPAVVSCSPARISDNIVRVLNGPGRVLNSPDRVPKTVRRTNVPGTEPASSGSRAANSIKVPNSARVMHSPRASDTPRVPPQQDSSESEDYVFKEDGNLDCEATFHRIWDNHLKSLVQCSSCGRNFAPERIERHQGGCTGISKKGGPRGALHRA